jgi:cyclohexanone monooxygenase
MHYLEALKDPRWEDWKFQYMSNNRFEYLGNGHSSSEKREGGSLSYYIRDHDDDEIDIVLKKPSKVHPELEGIVPSRDAIRAKL